MVFEILGHGFSLVKTLFDFGVSDVAAHNDGAVERQTGRYGIFCQFLEYLFHGAVEVDFYHCTLALLAIFLGDEFAGVGVEFFNPETLAVDFGLDVAVGRA